MIMVMPLENLAQRMKDYIEQELGLYVEARHNGRGYSFFPITTTGRIIGETRLMVGQTKNPVMFVTNRGYFTGREGMALASRFRTMIENEIRELSVLHLTSEMRIDGGETCAVDFGNVKKMAESLN